jgi:nickel-type superoxide dismutase maturation protease
MRPTLAPGDRLVVRYRRVPREGQVVVVRFADGTVAVKRAHGRRDGGWWVLGDRPDASIDSRHRGAVPDADVLAVVLARVWPRPRRM